MSGPQDSRVCAGSAESIAERGCVVVSGDRHGIAVFHDAGKFYAIDNRCPHMGFPLSKGGVRCGILTCHWHHARFDLVSGGAFDPSAAPYVLVGTARYLAAHAPTSRAMLQTARIALRLQRGDDLTLDDEG